MTILLAEDDLDDQELLKEAISELSPHIEVVSFTSGSKILDYLENCLHTQIPDMIILDYNIPEINGADILKQLANDARYQSVIKLVWSTSGFILYESSCLALGASAYLVKPSRIGDLKAMTNKILSFLPYRNDAPA